MPSYTSINISCSVFESFEVSDIEGVKSFFASNSINSCDTVRMVQQMILNKQSEISVNSAVNVCSIQINIIYSGVRNACAMPESTPQPVQIK